MKKNLLSIFALAVLMIVSMVGRAQTTYTRVNSASELEASAQYILVGFDNDGNAYAMGYQKTNNRHAIPISEDGGTVTTTVATDASSQTEPFEFTLFIFGGDWVINDPLNNGYLCAPGGGNYLKTQTDITDNSKWTITDHEEGGMVPVSNASVEQNIMRYNITSTLFGCYKSSSNVTAGVYFYKAGGAPVVHPEPTNYPTNFVASADGVDVTLTWTDATGAQLPSKYLIVGSTGNITVPTDGQPVADGNLTKNVNYGVQTYTFTGLTGGATYHFAIFPYTNSGANIDYKTDGSYPTANVTLQNVYFFVNENFANDLGAFTAINVIGDQEWHQGSYQSTTYANMNGYSGGAYYQNEDWLITPAIEVEADTWAELSFEFRSAMKFDGDPLTVWVSTDYDGASNPNNFTWSNITGNFQFSEGNYTWANSGAYVMSSPQPATYYFAFKYTSTDAAASSWEITDVKVMGRETVSVNEHSIQTISVYPNPAKDVVTINLVNDAQVSIFDITGRMVSTMNMNVGQGQCQVSNLENGVYFLNVRYADGKKEVARFVKF